jgi:peroxiredoxin Q/BCP
MKKQLQPGDNCPTFILEDQHGKQVSIQDHIGKTALVIFFYPKDDTRGCTMEACAFRDQYETFQDQGATVIGISSDSVSSHDRFAKKHQLPYILLADVKKEVRNAFGVPGNLFGLIPGRVTYIIDLQGIIRGVYNSQSDPIGHIAKALECIRSITA